VLGNELSKPSATAISTTPFEVMRGGLFERCYVESGALTWPNGLELCPDALLMEQIAPERQGRVLRRTRR
jgi:hypothetical protein